MANEIIKVFEYLTNNPDIKAAVTGVAVVYAVFFLLVVGFIGFVFWQLIKSFKDF